MSPLVIASHNEGKVREIRALLSSLGTTVISAGALNLPEPEETGSTFEENAVLKSTHAYRLSGHPALADDSGLCVAALGGAPGIYSARWAGKSKDFTPAMERIHAELTALGLEPDGQKAWFTCVLALTRAEGETQTFEGRVDGHLVFPPRGGKGFGYDPLFVPEGYVETFGEMDPEAKHAISHRAKAFAKFVAHMAPAKPGAAS